MGRFGPYVRHNGKFVSLGKNYDPYTITLDQAIELIKEKEKKEAEKFISEFPKADIQVLNGGFGPYIKHAGENYKIPKGVDAKSLDEAACLELIEATPPKATYKKKKK